MNTYVVDGTTTIGWSVTIQAKSAAEAEEKAKGYWEHNTSYENVDINAVYNEETGELQ